MELHAHTEYSNIRFLDSINTIEGLIDLAVAQNLAGICITDHETLSAHVSANNYADKIHKEHPNFKVGLGNEIYLCPDRSKKQKYYHFILIAKNKTGWRALRELSTRAWLNSYSDRNMERVVTTYADLEEIVNKYPDTLIATTACLGGELSTQTLNMIIAEREGNPNTQAAAHKDIVWFIQWCKKLFGKDFYIECAPGCSKEQIIVNQRLVSIAHCFNVKMVIGGDAHYLRPKDRYVHEAFLTSKEAEREVASFYEYAYQQTNEEVIQHLSKSNFDEMFVEEMFKNSLEIYDKIENYSIKHSQQIPRVEVTDYPKNEKKAAEMANYPHLASMFTSDDRVRRYWINQCYDAMYKKFPQTAQEETAYWQELDDEADIKETISQALNNNMFMYPVTLQHYIDMFWECGSTVGIGRGSACAGLNHYLLGVTQLDPIKYRFPFFRYLNKERLELGESYQYCRV